MYASSDSPDRFSNETSNRMLHCHMEGLHEESDFETVKVYNMERNMISLRCLVVDNMLPFLHTITHLKASLHQPPPFYKIDQRVNRPLTTHPKGRDVHTMLKFKVESEGFRNWVTPILFLSILSGRVATVICIMECDESCETSYLFDIFKAFS